MNFQVEVSLDSDDIAQACIRLSQKEAVEMIVKIDLAHADVGFTEDVIKRLVTSLKKDYDASPDEIDLPFINWDRV